MKAFVYAPNGRFPDVNYYLAYDGFNKLGYSSVMFDDIATADITRNTPCFAGARTFDKIMHELGVFYKRPETYPDSLSSFIDRKFTIKTLGQAKEEFDKSNNPIFVKPVKNKLFNGQLWETFMDLIPLVNVPDETEVLVSEKINILSEFRVYVMDHEIVAMKHYHGNLRLVPQEQFILDAINAYKQDAPAAYSLDVGVISENDYNKDTVIEVNDATSLGNYGLDSMRYAEMLTVRWQEIMNKK
jgi:hypothetical protein